MNWESLHPDEKTVDLEDADRIAAFARMHDRKIHWSQFGLGNPQSRMAHVGQFPIAKTFFRRRGVPIHGIGFQGGIYGQIVKICLQIPSCTAIQTWGVTRKCSWLGWTTHKTKAAGLVFDRQYHPKAAYKAFEEVLNKRPSQQN